MEPSALSGYLLILIAVALVAWAEWEFFRRGKGTALPFDPPRRLVTSGPYGWTRNPIYVGSVVSLLGAYLVVDWPLGIALSLAYLASLHLWITLWEEPRLERRYGDDYREYRRAVPRWLPHALRRPSPPTLPRGS